MSNNYNKDNFLIILIYIINYLNLINIFNYIIDILINHHFYIINIHLFYYLLIYIYLMISKNENHHLLYIINMMY